MEVWGNDLHTGALSLAVRDAEAAGVRDIIRFHHGDCDAWTLPHAPNLVVTNPPWGQRLMGREDGGGGGGGDGYADPAEAQLAAAWHGLSSFMKREAGGAWNSASRRLPLTVGGVDCRLLQYEIRGREGGAAQMAQTPRRRDELRF